MRNTFFKEGKETYKERGRGAMGKVLRGREEWAMEVGKGGAMGRLVEG